MKKIYSLTLLIALVVSGCGDFLGIKPKGALIPVTERDYEYMLNYAQLLKTGESYTAFLTDDAYLPYESENPFNQGYIMVDAYLQNAYTFEKNIFGPSEIDPLWEYTYNRIYYYNTIINWAEGQKDPSPKSKELLAEARTGRALEYLYLVNGYAAHFDTGTAKTDLAVPLVTQASTTQDQLPRATVQEVYDLILKDLLLAIPDLRVKPVLNAFRASKPGAYGLLARAYLYMGDYPKALTAAREVLKAKSEILDYTLLKKDPEKFNLSMVDIPLAKDNPEAIYARTPPYSFGNMFMVFPSSSLEKIFDHQNDQRWLFLYDHSRQTNYPGKEFIYFQSWELNLGISTPEVYLTAAECEARVGNLPKALEYLNVLRQKRIKNYEPIRSESRDEVLQEIINERRREFAEIGLFRLIDLKRLAKDPKLAVTFTRELDGKTWTIKPGDRRLILPIPEKILRKNPLLVQNER